MSQGDHIKISHATEVERKVPHLIKRLQDWDYSIPLSIKLEPWVDTRTLDQNALFHKWCRELSDKFIAKIPDATPDGVKWMMKHKFLVTKTIKVGQTTLKDQIQSTASLKKGEMCFFMDQVYAWAIEKGVYLSLPEYNEYTELKRKQEQ